MFRQQSGDRLPFNYGGPSYDGSMGPHRPVGHEVMSKMSPVKRLNLVAILVSLFVPWALYVVVSSLTVFSLHYNKPFVYYSVVSACGLVLLGFGALTCRQATLRENGKSRTPTWYTFLFVTCVVAFLSAAILGSNLYWTFMQDYYDLVHLSTYESVNPSTMRGQQLMDAGMVDFKYGTAIDTDLAMSFKNDKLYCVAPLTYDSLELAAYDFWVVGVDCCSEDATEFSCGSSESDARSGLRMVHSAYREWYRLAVQQAASYHEITVIHPLFFTWVDDAETSAEVYFEKGNSYFFMGVLVYFALQFVLVVAASYTFGHTSMFRS
mmetsp:Transcript_19705/g.52636  ORF Transcript_19705/g.52636 Transcript_19705/m.52636 type:complete len:322 (-) Transcript_19705:322-1287(-)